MFLLFAYSDYCPKGRWKDYKGSFPTPEAALEAVANMHGIDSWHVVAGGLIIHEGRRDY